MEEILSTLQTIFRQVFADENMCIDLETNPDQIETWDSLRHAILIDAVEKKFEIKFNLMEMISFDKVGDICEGINAKLQ